MTDSDYFLAKRKWIDRIGSEQSQVVEREVEAGGFQMF